MKKQQERHRTQLILRVETHRSTLQQGQINRAAKPNTVYCCFRCGLYSRQADTVQIKPDFNIELVASDLF